MWKKRILSLVITTILVMSTLSIITTDKVKGSNGAILYVGGPGPGNYTTIQSAIDNASDGYTVFVYNGIYYENVNIDKSVNLTGENKDNTIIDGGGTSHVIYVSSNWTSISGFNIQNCGSYGRNGISLMYTNYNTITGNIITNNNGNGLYLYSSINNTITGNIITNNNDYGISLNYCSNNALIGNTITGNNGVGLHIYSSASSPSHNNNITGNIITNNNGHGLYLYGSNNNNSITGNIITNNNGEGLYLYTSCNNNDITENIITGNNQGGMYLDYCISNTIKGNTLTENYDEGIYLDSSNRNTVLGNTIKNNSDEGIGIGLSNSNTVVGNIITNTGGEGILLASSMSNIITGNTITGSNEEGIYLGSSSSNTVTGNTVVDSNYEGIEINSCSGNTIMGNTITNSSDHGIYLYSSSSSTITGNTIAGNHSYGLCLSSCSSNTITSNTIAGNHSYGLYLTSSSSNTITGNTITDSYYAGIGLWSSTINNKIFHNNFFNNGPPPQASDWTNPGNNMWHDGYPSGGNYWNDFDEPAEGAYDNYNGPNQDIPGGDGIVDGGSLNPYNIYGEGSQDKYPLINPYNITSNQPPLCSVLASPSSGIAPLGVAFLLSGSDSDGSIEWWSLDIDNDGTIEYSGNGNPPPVQVHTYQTAGSFTAKFGLMDNDGATCSKLQYVTISSPPNQLPTSVLSATPAIGPAPLITTFQLTANDYDGSITQWTLDIDNDGLPEYAGTGNPPSIKQHMYTASGTYAATFTVTDNQGATNTSNFTITVLNITPVSIDPLSQTVNGGETFTINIMVEPGEAIAGIQLNLSYDPSLLLCENITEGNIFSGYDTYFNPGVIDNINGTITEVIGLIILGNATLNGIFVQINFTAKTVDGLSAINLSNVVVGDNEANPLPIVVNNGTVTVTAYPDWDVNMDGRINILDLITIGQQWMETGTPGWMRADTNRDGIINILDMILVGQHWTG